MPDDGVGGRDPRIQADPLSGRHRPFPHRHRRPVGLLKHLLFWPVTGPEFLVKFSLDKVQGAVREQLTDDQSVKEDLLSLQMRLELGEIDDEQYVEEEAALMARLREVRRWREEFGMGTGGGPVRVARVASESEGGTGTGDEAGRETVEDGADRDAPAPPRGIASPEGASVEIRFDEEEWG